LCKDIYEFNFAVLGQRSSREGEFSRRSISKGSRRVWVGSGDLAYDSKVSTGDLEIGVLDPDVRRGGDMHDRSTEPINRWWYPPQRGHLGKTNVRGA
jgi:hypothetical protein